MIFIEAFRTTFGAILELVLLGAIGFYLIKRRLLSDEGLQMLSNLVIGLFLPCFIFAEIFKKFTFSLYPDWWTFPLYSVLVSAVGFVLGLAFLRADGELHKDRQEFLGITTFQNSGYLPLPLVASLLPAGTAQQMFIYIFLFLLGFNVMIFSFGSWLLCNKSDGRRFDFKHMFNAPVIATLSALVCVFLNIHRFLPDVVFNPIELLGRCAIPLSILVVGGNLASLKTNGHSYAKSLKWGLLIKLIILPFLFLWLVILTKPKPLVGLLLVLQAAMPPATLLSVISKVQQREGPLVNQAIFYGHLISIVTIPLFLALFWIFSMTFY
jgi:predicted permease